MNRRTFLQSLGVGTAAAVVGSAVGPRWARAQGVERNFLFCYFNGGWDTLLCLDPRDPNVFTEARSAETRIQLGWDRLDPVFPQTILQPRGSLIEFGPVMGQFSRHFDKSCVVRGISMDTVTHEVGRRFFLTGKAPRGLAAAGSSVPTLIASQQGAYLPIPNLVSRVESYNESEPSWASAMSVSSVEDLVSALSDGPQAPGGAVRTRLDEFRLRHRNCDPALLDQGGLLSLIRDSQVGARGLVAGGLSRHFQFLNANDPEMVALRQRYGIQSLASPAAQAAMAFQALRQGLAQNVTIELAAGLDTHDDTWATDHPVNLAAAFDALAVLVDDLAATESPQGGALLDHTTIVCFSEFGRTPLLNNRDGRDHSLSSCALIVGAGVPHNKVVGGTSDVGLNPVAIDPDSGEPVDSGGVTLSPPLIIASLLEGAGYDPSDLRTGGLPCLIG